MEANFLNLIISWQQKKKKQTIQIILFYMFIYIYVCFYIYTLTGYFIAYTCYIPHYCIS